ncbi:hypothetical protein L2E82_40539 [Cichorium intybus]|uniref:Uncharacterized protein n=1 Tax=Cichorium intybus TaxID=13427 RepID=A0ACB9AKQ7_CICIN|nr:hypothetical protein L2E82_40539 [Cichorium intybus]
MKGKFMDDASFAHVAATVKNKVIVKQKIEAASLSSSSSNEETSEEHKVFTCSSCSRKFSNQHAMAGHRNIHRSEWESILQDISEEGKMQSIKLPCNLQSFHLHNATIPLKQQSSGNSHSTLSNNTSSTIHKTLPCPPPYPSANARNLLQEPPVRARTHSLVNPTSSLKHPSACVPCYPLVNSTNTLKGPVPRYPLANHRNILKRQSPNWPLANPTNSLGRLAACAPRCPLIDPVNTLEGPSSKHPMVNPTKNLNEQSPRYPLANPTYTQKGPPVTAACFILANPLDTQLIGSPLGAPDYTFLRPTKTLRKPLVADHIHALDNRVNPHGKSALGVRRLSMIHKPCQFKQADIWSRAGSTSFGGNKMMEGNIRRFGTNDNNVYFISVSRAEHAPSRCQEGGGSSEARDFFSSSFPSTGGRGIKAHNLFAPTPTQERQNTDHSSEGPATPWNNNGENESSLDIDLELKL